MATGAVDARWRYNEFTGTYNPLTITDEEHTCEYIEEFNAYGIFANEAIQFDTPSSLVVKQGVATYTEVSYSTAPAAGQYRASYDVDGHENSGFIEMHSSENGKLFKISYKGRGTINHPTFRMNTYHNFPGNVDIENDLDVWTGKLQVTTNGVGVNAVPVSGIDLTVSDNLRVVSSTGAYYNDIRAVNNIGYFTHLAAALANAEVRIDAQPDNNTAASSYSSAIHFWRNTRTNGAKAINFHRGNASADNVQSRIGVDGLYSYFTNTAIHIGASSDPGANVLEITGNAKFNGDVILGDAEGDTIDVNGTLNGNADTGSISGAIIPVSGINFGPAFPPYPTCSGYAIKINHFVTFDIVVDLVTVSTIDINAATAIFDISLPFSPSFGAAADLKGFGNIFDSTGAILAENLHVKCTAETANERLRVTIISDGAVDLSDSTIQLTGTYYVP